MVGLVIITLIFNNRRMEMTQAWRETLSRTPQCPGASRICIYVCRVLIWGICVTRSPLWPFAIKHLRKIAPVISGPTSLALPSLQPLPTCFLGAAAWHKDIREMGDWVSVTGADLRQPGQGELSLYSNVSNRSGTEIESAAAPKNPLSLEVPLAARHKPTGSSGKEQFIPRYSADQPEMGSQKKVPRKWLNSKDP